jgi:integrase
MCFLYASCSAAVVDRQPRKRITKRGIQAATIRDREYFLWDDEVSGFGVRIWPSGRKVYVYQYRNALNRTRRPVIATTDTLSPEIAREIAKDWAEVVRRGGDPKAIERAARSSPTVEALADRYLSEHGPKKRESSVRMDRSNLRNHVLPALGDKLVIEVDRRDIGALHHSMRDTPGAANRVLALLSKMFSLAERWGLRGDGTNPCRHIDKYPEQKIERYLSADELARLAAALNEAEHTATELQSAIDAVRMLIFTGARRGEVLGLKWSEVDTDRGMLHLADSKTGKKTLYLSGPALEILKGIEPQPGNPFVFAGAKSGSALVNLSKPWKRLCKAAQIEGVRLHDLRHSFASIGAGRGLSLPVIGALLGHQQAATTQRYAHLAADPLKQASSLIGEQIAAAMRGDEEDSE